MTSVPIPIEADGLDLNYLEQELEKLPQVEVTTRHPYKAAVYLIPTHQNPTGCCYSPGKHEVILNHDMEIFCDQLTLSFDFEFFFKIVLNNIYIMFPLNYINLFFSEMPTVDRASSKVRSPPYL